MKNVKGFTLVEVLVSVLILSTGLLGLVGLQTAGMRNITGSYNRTQASLLASSMADRIRANVANLTAASSIYASKGASLNCPTPIPNTAGSGCNNPQTNCTNATGCSPAAMAENDLYEWKQALQDTANGLPKTGTIAVADQCSATPASPMIQVTVTVSWNEGRDDNKDGTTDPDLAFLTIFKIPRNPC